MKSVNDADRNNEIIVDVAPTHFNPDEVQNDAGLAGMLRVLRLNKKLFVILS